MKVRLIALGLFLIPWLLWTSTSAASLLEITAKSLPDFQDKNPANIRLYAADSGQLKAIPFQTSGTGKDISVLAFSEDFGAQIDAAKWPAASFRYEVRADPAGTRVAYLTWEENPSARVEKSYVRYDANLDQVESDQYAASFLKKTPLVQDSLIIKSASAPQDILDRFKVRLNLAIKNFFDFKIDEGEISSQVLSVDAGPIRVHRTVIASKRIGPIKLMPKSRIDFYFYPGWVEVVSEINNPVDGPKVLEAKTSGASGYDFNALVRGSTFHSSDGTRFTLDGKPHVTEGELAKNKLSWWSISGTSGHMVVRVQNDPKLSKLGIEPAFMLSDDISRPEKPEAEDGGIFLGFNLPYHRIPKGEYRVRVTQVFPKTLNTDGELAVLAASRTLNPEVRKLP